MLARLCQLIALVAVGALIAVVTGMTDLQNAGWYGGATALLLAIGLYASTYGISLAQAREDAGLIVAAVTVGVLVKALLIGGVMVLLFHDPRLWVVGIAVAQIDPLSVSALMRENRMSERAKSVLAAWSSFDDPMTVLLVLYVPVLIGQPQPRSATVISGIGSWGYPLSVGANLVFAAAIGVLWWFARRRVASAVALAVIGYALAAVSFALATGYLLMLGLALIGLVLRPARLDRLLDWVSRCALAAATLLLGLLVGHGVNVGRGLALGAAAFAAQMLVAVPLTRRLPRLDRVHLICAQQNGITAIVLALLLEPTYPGAVATIAVAIVAANLLHLVANAAVDRRFARPVGDPHAGYPKVNE